MVKVYKNLLGNNSQIHGDTIAIKDVTEKFTMTSTVNFGSAYLMGKLLFLNFEVQPANGWVNVARTTTLLPINNYALSVHKGSNYDADKDITAEFNTAGQITTRAGNTFTNTVRISGVVILK